MVAFKRKQEPELCTYVNDERTTITLEIALPGVTKENIKIKVNSRCLLLSAASDDVNYTKYVPFVSPVEANRARAIFEHDLLRIVVPMRA